MLLSINDEDPRPVYIQIANQIKEQIQRGNLKPGDALPSIRDVAANLGINMHTVRRAYGVLRDQKLLAFRLGQQAKVTRLRNHPPDEDITREIGERLRELITESLLAGLSADDFLNMVNEQMQKLKENSQ